MSSSIKGFPVRQFIPNENLKLLYIQLPKKLILCWVSKSIQILIFAGLEKTIRRLCSII